MRLKINISLDNDAFFEHKNEELARIFTKLANNIDMIEDEISLKDINGNTVGNLKFIKDDINSNVGTVKELKKLLNQADDEALVCVWSWFIDGGRIYSITPTLMNLDERKRRYHKQDYFVIGGFDDCLANRPDLM